MAISVRPLRREDDRSGFASGDPDLDRFFHRYAGQSQFRHHIGTTYVAAEGEKILGFATVAPAHVEIEHLPAARRRRLPHYPLPVLRLARLATVRTARGQGVGRLMLRAVFDIARRMAVDIGCLGVLVDAKPDAIGFYEEFGFVRIAPITGKLSVGEPEPTPMFLELGALSDL